MLAFLYPIDNRGLNMDESKLIINNPNEQEFLETLDDLGDPTNEHLNHQGSNLWKFGPLGDTLSTFVVKGKQDDYLILVCNTSEAGGPNAHLVPEARVFMMKSDGTLFWVGLTNRQKTSQISETEMFPLDPQTHFREILNRAINDHKLRLEEQKLFPVIKPHTQYTPEVPIWTFISQFRSDLLNNTPNPTQQTGFGYGFHGDLDMRFNINCMGSSIAIGYSMYDGARYATDLSTNATLNLPTAGYSFKYREQRIIQSQKQYRLDVFSYSHLLSLQQNGQPLWLNLYLEIIDDLQRLIYDPSSISTTTV